MQNFVKSGRIPADAQIPYIVEECRIARVVTENVQMMICSSHHVEEMNSQLHFVVIGRADVIGLLVESLEGALDFVGAFGHTDTVSEAMR
jgi:hypothetical protein